MTIATNMITLPCPHCRQLLDAEARIYGKTVPCLACKKPITIPCGAWEIDGQPVFLEPAPIDVETSHESDDSGLHWTSGRAPQGDWSYAKVVPRPGHRAPQVAVGPVAAPAPGRLPWRPFAQMGIAGMAIVVSIWLLTAAAPQTVCVHAEAAAQRTSTLKTLLKEVPAARKAAVAKFRQLDWVYDVEVSEDRHCTVLVLPTLDHPVMAFDDLGLFPRQPRLYHCVGLVDQSFGEAFSQLSIDGAGHDGSWLCPDALRELPETTREAPAETLWKSAWGAVLAANDPQRVGPVGRLNAGQQAADLPAPALLCPAPVQLELSDGDLVSCRDLEALVHGRDILAQALVQVRAAWMNRDLPAVAEGLQAYAGALPATLSDWQGQVLAGQVAMILAGDQHLSRESSLVVVSAATALQRNGLFDRLRAEGATIQPIVSAVFNRRTDHVGGVLRLRYGDHVADEHGLEIDAPILTQLLSTAFRRDRDLVHSMTASDWAVPLRDCRFARGREILALAALEAEVPASWLPRHAFAELPFHLDERSLAYDMQLQMVATSTQQLEPYCACAVRCGRVDSLGMLARMAAEERYSDAIGMAIVQAVGATPLPEDLDATMLADAVYDGLPALPIHGFSPWRQAIRPADVPSALRLWEGGLVGDQLATFVAAYVQRGLDACTPERRAGYLVQWMHGMMAGEQWERVFARWSRDLRFPLWRLIMEQMANEPLDHLSNEDVGLFVAAASSKAHYFRDEGFAAMWATFFEQHPNLIQQRAWLEAVAAQNSIVPIWREVVLSSERPPGSVGQEAIERLALWQDPRVLRHISDPAMFGERVHVVTTLMGHAIRADDLAFAGRCAAIALGADVVASSWAHEVLSNADGSTDFAALIRQIEAHGGRCTLEHLVRMLTFRGQYGDYHEAQRALFTPLLDHIQRGEDLRGVDKVFLADLLARLIPDDAHRGLGEASFMDILNLISADEYRESLAAEDLPLYRLCHHPERKAVLLSVIQRQAPELLHDLEQFGDDPYLDAMSFLVECNAAQADEHFEKWLQVAAGFFKDEPIKKLLQGTYQRAQDGRVFAVNSPVMKILARSGDRVFPYVLDLRIDNQEMLRRYLNPLVASSDWGVWHRQLAAALEPGRDYRVSRATMVLQILLSKLNHAPENAELHLDYLVPRLKAWKQRESISWSSFAPFINEYPDFKQYWEAY